MAELTKNGRRAVYLRLYTRDWRADPPLRMCSYAARGLWIDILTLMFESNCQGFLLVEGKPPTPKQLAALLGSSEGELKRLLGELARANIYSITGGNVPTDVAALIPENVPDGVMFSRRMLRDKAKGERDRNNGAGGGNPSLNPPDKPGVNPADNPGVNHRVKAHSQSHSHNQFPKEIGSSESPRPVAAREGLEGPTRDAVVSLLANARQAVRAS
jgi:hypothetical protein